MRIAILLAILFPSAVLAVVDEAWVDIWNGPGVSHEMGKAVEFDGAGNVYVGGTVGVHDGTWHFAIALRKMDGDGGLLWERRFADDPSEANLDLSVGGDGTATLAGYVYSGGVPAVALLRYGAAGDTIFQATLPIAGSLHFDSCPRLVVAPSGDTYVVARSDGDYLTIRFDGNGDTLWTRAWGDSAGGDDDPTGIAIDSAGHVFVTGTGANLHEHRTISYDQDGSFRWDHRLVGDIGSTFGGGFVEVDPAGNVLVTGNPESVCGVFQVKVWKLDPSGTELWRRSFPDNPCHSVEIEGFGVDVDGNAVFTGGGYVDSFSTHYQTVKYDPDGTRLWHAVYDGPGTSTDLPFDLVIAESGRIYIAGETTYPPQNRDYATVCYEPDGSEAWSDTWAGPSGGNDRPLAIGLSPSGSAVAVTGYYFESGEGDNAATVLYRPDVSTGAPIARAGSSSPLAFSPNPFRAKTTFSYRLPAPGAVELSVYDLSGRRARTLVEETRAEGGHSVSWDGRDDRGKEAPSGVYFARFRAGEREETARVIRLR